MFVVVFEVSMKPGVRQDYFDLAAELRPELDKIGGFISVEQFQSLVNGGKYVSNSFWRDAGAIADWRVPATHRLAQDRGKNEIFADFRISVCAVQRQYTLADRLQAAGGG